MKPSGVDQRRISLNLQWKKRGTVLSYGESKANERLDNPQKETKKRLNPVRTKRSAKEGKGQSPLLRRKKLLLRGLQDEKDLKSKQGRSGDRKVDRGRLREGGGHSQPKLCWPWDRDQSVKREGARAGKLETLLGSARLGNYSRGRGGEAERLVGRRRGMVLSLPWNRL